MKTFTSHENICRVARKLPVASLISAMLIVPTTASAGPLDGLKSRAQQAAGRVTELRNNVQAKVENVKDKIEDLDGEGLEQLMETVGSMLQYVKQAQAGYKEFVGADKCGMSSPCGKLRGNLRKMVESFIKLPGELHFIEHMPPVVQKLEKFAKVIDLAPPPLLFVTEKVMGNAFEEVQYRLDLVRFAVNQAPRFPTMAELANASSGLSIGNATRVAGSNPADFPYCAALLDSGKPHVELVTKALEHVGDFMWDLADMMEDSKTVVVNAVAGGGTSVKNPVKGTTQLVGFVIKSLRQVAELKVAATASVCAMKGYKPAA